MRIFRENKIIKFTTNFNLQQCIEKAGEKSSRVIFRNFTKSWITVHLTCFVSFECWMKQTEIGCSIAAPLITIDTTL